MRHVVKTILPYSNFNESAQVEVKKLSVKGYCVSGITCYREAYNCSLFLEEATVTLVLESEKYMLVKGMEYFLRPGDLLYIPANTLVFTDIPKGKSNFRSLNLVLSDAAIRTLFGAQQGGNFSLNRRVIKAREQLSTMNEIKRLLGEFPAEENKHEQLFLKLLRPIQSQLFEHIPNQEKESSVKVINNVLLQSLHRPLNLSQMASLSCMSLATFKRRFKAIYGVSAKTWLRDQRLQAAFFQLKTNKERVSDTLAHFGFSNFSHFSYLFRKTFNTRPSREISQN